MSMEIENLSPVSAPEFRVKKGSSNATIIGENVDVGGTLQVAKDTTLDGKLEVAEEAQIEKKLYTPIIDAKTDNIKIDKPVNIKEKITIQIPSTNTETPNPYTSIAPDAIEIGTAGGTTGAKLSKEMLYAGQSINYAMSGLQGFTYTNTLYTTSDDDEKRKFTVIGNMEDRLKSLEGEEQGATITINIVGTALNNDNSITLNFRKLGPHLVLVYGYGTFYEKCFADATLPITSPGTLGKSFKPSQQIIMYSNHHWVGDDYRTQAEGARSMISIETDGRVVLRLFTQNTIGDRDMYYSYNAIYWV